MSKPLYPYTLVLSFLGICTVVVWYPSNFGQVSISTHTMKGKKMETQPSPNPYNNQLKSLEGCEVVIIYRFFGLGL